jgi:hypothetical protein
MCLALFAKSIFYIIIQIGIFNKSRTDDRLQFYSLYSK